MSEVEGIVVFRVDFTISVVCPGAVVNDVENLFVCCVTLVVNVGVASSNC